MANALQPVATCDILIRHPRLTFREGPFTSEIVRNGNRSILTVSNGDRKLALPMLWAFGVGSVGQTYVFEFQGSLFESRVSYFNALGALDLTMGAPPKLPSSLEEAAGQRMDKNTARDCFACHSMGAVRQTALHLEDMSPGVGCESCHDSGVHHAAAMRPGGRADVESGVPRLSRLSSEAISDLCGVCHRTWSQILMNGPRGVNNVRFQPYRLTNSKCYDATDRRIGCTACHDPHSRPVHDAGFYDSKCTACHTGVVPTRNCPTATSNCVTCHMPRIELPGSHAAFTDHQIRIVRAGDPYPN